jgi:hypothetical protein
MAIVNMPDNVFILLNGTTLSGTPVSSDGLNVDTWVQAMVVVCPSGMTGTVRVKIQWSDDSIGSDNTAATGGHWSADPVQYSTGATPSGSELTIPLYEQEHSWNANAPLRIAAPVSGKFMRVVVEGTDGTVLVKVRKQR